MQTRTHHGTRFGAGIAAIAFGATLVFADDLLIVNPPPANPAVGVTANAIPSNFSLQRLAQGSDPLENPSGVIEKFGLLHDGTRTEPDENTYVVLDHDPGGPDGQVKYGRHFLFQGHENAANLAYVTRINLDVTDPAHRITLLTAPDAVSGKTGLNSIDGSTWDPFTETLLLTQEAGTNGGVIELPVRWLGTTPPSMRKLDCSLGKAGYEGIHPDDKGSLYLAEDVGGSNVSIDPANINGTVKVAKQPNSFIYRFEPNNRYDLSQGGRLYALQASVGSPLTPLVFGGASAAAAFADVYSQAQKDLRTPGTSWPAVWVLVHDTGGAPDPATCSAFDANAAAKTAHATPFKRPENLQFLPGSRFDTFFFDETGDTDSRSGQVPELAARGAWGSIFRVRFPWASSNGNISIVIVGDKDHAAFDNLAFGDGETLLATEDRGDMLHDQLNLLDSVWAFDVVDGDHPARRLIGLGRDAVAAPVGEEDNEPTGLHVSDGAASVGGLLGSRVPRVKTDDEGNGQGNGKSDEQGFRWFVTQQHGLNQVFEILQFKVKK
jgi:hypothetical protein